MQNKIKCRLYVLLRHCVCDSSAGYTFIFVHELNKTQHVLINELAVVWQSFHLDRKMDSLAVSTSFKSLYEAANT